MRPDRYIFNHRARFHASSEPRALARAEPRRSAKPGSGDARRLFAPGRSGTVGRRGAPAFTLVELLVVLVIITILVSAVLVGSTTLINRARSKKTELALQIVREAVEEFEREQTARPTITRVRQGAGSNEVRYGDRYGLYPPDELELFTEVGLPGSSPAAGSLAVGHSKSRPVVVVPAPSGGQGYPQMQFHPAADQEFEHRDLAALVLTIEMFGDASSTILEKLPDEYRVPGAQFLDRDDNEKWDPETDQEIYHLVDGWGTPLNYFAQRDYDSGADSNNASGWNQASTAMVRLNGGQPVIVSYGPDGSEQFSEDILEAEPSASLIVDLLDDRRVDNPLNEDNVYADPALKEKLARGIP